MWFLSNQNQAFRLCRVERTEVIFPVCAEQLQAGSPKHGLKITQGEQTHTFPEMVLQFAGAELDVFEHIPAPDVLFQSEEHAIHHFFFRTHQIVLHPVGIEIIEQQQTARFQSFIDIDQGQHMIAVGGKVAETRKHVHHAVEIVDSERLPHIVLVKCQPQVLKLAGIGDAGRGNIQSCDFEALIGQEPAVASLAASQIEQACAGRQIDGLQQVIQGALSLFFIPAFVQQVVIGRIKP